VILLLLGDGHFSKRKPENRLDIDYFGAQLGKLNQVAMIYHKHKCDGLLQVGDFFESWRIGHEVVADIISNLDAFKMKIFLVWGQHDIYGHSVESFISSPLMVLIEAGLCTLLLDSPIHRGLCSFYGAPFGCRVPVPSVDDSYKVLVVHQMVGDKPLFPGQDIVHPQRFLKEHKEYNLIVCGDYHYRFIEERDGRFCINPGALVRKTISERDLEHEPAVVLFDTIENRYEVIKLEVESVEDIFSVKRKEKKGEHDYATLLKFLENLKESRGTYIGWKDILAELIKKDNIPSKVVTMIDECIAEVEG